MTGHKLANFAIRSQRWIFAAGTAPAFAAARQAFVAVDGMRIQPA
jgi:hypothetical protein